MTTRKIDQVDFQSVLGQLISEYSFVNEFVFPMCDESAPTQAFYLYVPHHGSLVVQLVELRNDENYCMKSKVTLKGGLSDRQLRNAAQDLIDNLKKI